MKTITYLRTSRDGTTEATAPHVKLVCRSVALPGYAKGATKQKARMALQKKLMAQSKLIEDALNQISRDIEREEA